VSDSADRKNRPQAIPSPRHSKLLSPDSGHAVLSDTACRDKKSGDYRAVIETRKGSRNNDAAGGHGIPFDFGFIPSTLGGDGDPLDVLVLMDAPIMAGCVLRCRLIGVIEAREKERGKDWERNDRLIAVARHARTHEGVKTLAQLRAHTLDDIKAFFVD
jgi:inorganic pyrophosphatase